MSELEDGGRESDAPRRARRERRQSALEDFVSRWWAVAIALTAVIGAYFQTRAEIAAVRTELGEVRGQVTRLRQWIEHPEQFPGREADGALPDTGGAGGGGGAGAGAGARDGGAKNAGDGGLGGIDKRRNVLPKPKPGRLPLRDRVDVWD
jgi:hypothetical protein